MKRLAMWSCAVGIVALSLPGMLFVSGCDSGDGGSIGGGNDDDVIVPSVVGVWGTFDSETRTVFREDGTWNNYRSPALSSPHVSGTYTQSGLSVTGTGVNPGVGDLEIEATLSEDGETLVYDFIEHWHYPYKHNVYTFTRM